MQNDLISRSALMSHIESERREWGEDYDAEQILGDIEDMPVAYDPDKAIESIETKILGKVCIGCGYLKNNICTYKGSNCGVSKPMYDDIKKVFQEVKGGGVDE